MTAYPAASQIQPVHLRAWLYGTAAGPAFYTIKPSMATTAASAASSSVLAEAQDLLASFHSLQSRHGHLLRQTDHAASLASSASALRASQLREPTPYSAAASPRRPQAAQSHAQAGTQPAVRPQPAASADPAWDAPVRSVDQHAALAAKLSRDQAATRIQAAW